MLGPRGPASGAGNPDEEVLATQVLGVARRIDAGCQLDEGRELEPDRGRAGGERLERRGGAESALNAADERLRDTGLLGDLSLGQARASSGVP